MWPSPNNSVALKGIMTLRVKPYLQSTERKHHGGRLWIQLCSSQRRENALLLFILPGPATATYKNLVDKVANMSAHFSQMPLSWQHNFDPDTFFVLGFADINPFLLRVPEVHTENYSVSSDLRVTVGVAKRYLVSDNAKKIKVVTR
jgi:hypothetical protein